MEDSWKRQKVINSSSFMRLTDTYSKLETHIQSKNNEGWELLSVFVHNIGIDEQLHMLWKKTVSIDQQGEHYP